MSTITISDVQKHYRQKPALKAANLAIEANQIYALLGRNGVGKSTLMRIITNRTRIKVGTVTLDGESGFENERAQNRIYLMSTAKL